MLNLCVFRADEFGKGEDGFFKALNDGAVYDIEADLGDCSYTNMYSVSAMADGVAKCLGQNNVEIGVYRTQNDGNENHEFVSLSEMNDAAHDGSWDSINTGFDAALEWRKNSSERVAYVFSLYCKHGISVHSLMELKLSDIANIGKTLTEERTTDKNNQPLYFNADKFLWVGDSGHTQNDEYKVNLKTGSPIFD